MTSAVPHPPRPPRRRWLPWLWVGVVVAVAVPLLAVGGIWFAVQGGWDGIRPRAEPTDDDVVQARQDADDEQQVRTAEVQDLALGATGGEVLGTGVVDACDEGWNNWKVRDPFTLRCTTTWAATLGLPADADLGTTARALDDALAAAGWSPDGGTGLVDPDQAFPNGRYSSDDDPDLALVVSVESSYDSAASVLGSGGGREVWREGDLEGALQAGDGHPGPVVEISVEDRYFQDG